jgi:YgiT-type zinc finger domain-containing protein
VKCIICKQGETRPGLTTVRFERDGLTLVIEQVPARLCPACGEAYADETASARLLDIATRMATSGRWVEVRSYEPA